MDAYFSSRSCDYTRCMEVDITIYRILTYLTILITVTKSLEMVMSR